GVPTRLTAHKSSNVIGRFGGASAGDSGANAKTNKAASERVGVCDIILCRGVGVCDIFVSRGGVELFADGFIEFVFGRHGQGEPLRFVELAAGLLAGDDEI